jgi:crotonobetainyl-CoA:carnitine CoA-transferase CaiB-like acyl-CoA transferase
MWQEIEKSLVEKSTADVVAGAERDGVALGRVNTVDEFRQDPQVRHNRSVVEYRDEEFGLIRHLNYPARFEKSPACVEARAPKLGEHSDLILAELGMSPHDIGALRQAGVVG